MMETPIYQFVRDKLVLHGVKRTENGLRTLNDKRLFLLFVELERARRLASFDKVLAVANAIENYLVSIDKRHLMAFVYLYLKFSDFTPSERKADERLPDGRVKRISIFRRNITDEEMLIGLWANVMYDQIGERYLRVVYAYGKLPAS